MNYEFGDIIFEDSDKGGPKIVKYFMRSPNVWVDLWRMLNGRLQKSEYYHPAVALGNSQMAEQQLRVQITSIENFNQNKFIVFRRKNITHYQATRLNEVINKEQGQLWGIIQTFGKFATWLTGIPLFSRYFKLPNEEVSATRVARWYYKAFGETFGLPTYQENSTHTMVTYMLNHPETYTIIEKVG